MTMPDGVPQGPWHPTAWPPLSDPRTTEQMCADAQQVIADLEAAVARSRQACADGPVVALPPHLPGLAPLVDPALREVA